MEDPIKASMLAQSETSGSKTPSPPKGERGKPRKIHEMINYRGCLFSNKNLPPYIAKTLPDTPA
jgi:hypothetical protein